MKSLPVIVVLALLISCSEPYPGFKQTSHGYFMRLDEFGEAGIPLNANSYVAVQYAYCTDSECNKTSSTKIGLFDNGLLNIDYDSLLQFNIGDKYVLIIDPQYVQDRNGLFEEFSEKRMIIQFEVVAAINGHLFFGNESFRDTLFGYRERSEIKRLIQRDTLHHFTEKEKCFLSIVKEGEGDTVSVGRVVALAYQGYFLDGRQFDDTDKQSDTMHIVYGKPFQIIDGLSAAIFGLRAGTETKIIIPSRFAFGKSGSSSGIIPPDEPLIYHLKILSVK